MQETVSPQLPDTVSSPQLGFILVTAVWSWSQNDLVLLSSPCLQEWGGRAAVSRNGGDRGLLPGPADPWHTAGRPVQCWYQHFGAGAEPQCQHGHWGQKPREGATNPCAGAGWLPRVLWYRGRLLLTDVWFLIASLLGLMSSFMYTQSFRRECYSCSTSPAKVHLISVLLACGIEFVTDAAWLWC